MDPIDAATLFLIGPYGDADNPYLNSMEGRATSDSENGYVMVDLGGVVVSGDGGQSVSLPTEVDVRNDDIVTVTLRGVKGGAKRATVTGVIGGGDRTRGDIVIASDDAVDRAVLEAQAIVDEVEEAAMLGIQEALDAAAAVEESANEAIAQANNAINAVNQHFWADGNGAHVSTEDNKADGLRNLLLNSLGILLRKGQNIIAQFTEGTVSFYDGAGNDAANVIATYGSTSSRIGKSSGKNIGISSSGIIMQDNGKWITQHTASSVSFYDGSGNEAANVIAQYSSSAVRIGKTSGNNMNISSGGFVMQNNGKYITQHTSSSVMFYDGSGNDASNVTAQFGSTSARIGKSGGRNMYIDSTSMKVRNGSTVRAEFGDDATFTGTAGKSKISNDGITVYDAAGTTIMCHLSSSGGTSSKIDCKQLTTIWKAYNPNTGVHYFTANSGEYNNLVNAGWTGEGPAFYAFW